jgi:hypothetical protein
LLFPPRGIPISNKENYWKCEIMAMGYYGTPNHIYAGEDQHTFGRPHPQFLICKYARAVVFNMRNAYPRGM